MGYKKSHDIFLPERLGFVARSKAISVAPVVQKMYSAIHWINCYPVDTVRKTNCAIQWSGAPGPVDRDFCLLDDGWRYQPFEQLG